MLASCFDTQLDGSTHLWRLGTSPVGSLGPSSSLSPIAQVPLSMSIATNLAIVLCLSLVSFDVSTKVELVA